MPEEKLTYRKSNIEGNEDQDKMEEKLKEIMALVNEKQMMAETKNGVIVAFSSACMFGAWNLLKDVNTLEALKLFDWVSIYLYVFSGFQFLASLIAIASFIPNTNSIDDCEEEHNIQRILLFFGEIAKFESSTSYIASLYQRYFENYEINKSKVSKLELDYANLIIMNAKITCKKFKLAGYAIYALVVAFLPITLPYFAYRVSQEKAKSRRNESTVIMNRITEKT